MNFSMFYHITAKLWCILLGDYARPNEHMTVKEEKYFVELPYAATFTSSGVFLSVLFIYRLNVVNLISTRVDRESLNINF